MSARRSAELRLAPIEDADTAARHGDIEVVVTQVTSRAGGLDDHGLASHRSRGEGEA